MLFDEPTLRKLEQLTLVADQVRVGMLKGDRRSKKRGSSVEFADYREYVRGDDLRRLDWNVFARLERPFIKLLEEEEDLAVHILVDASASMDWPTDEAHNKFTFARRLAGALAHIGLATGDLLTVSLLSGDGRKWGPFRGQQNSLRVFQFLESGTASGRTDLNISLRDYALRGRRAGLLFLISDLLSPNGYQDGVRALQARGYEVGILHTLSPDEVEPPLAGDLKLVDVETGADAEITLDHATRTRYQTRLREWQTEIATFCQNRAIHYVPITTDQGWDVAGHSTILPIMHTLRTKGIVR